MRVRSIMRPATVRVSPAARCGDVLDLLRAHDADCAVVESDGRVSGLVAVEELERAAADQGALVGTLAREIPVELTPDDSIARARALMKDHDQKHLLVAVDDGTLATISWSDVAATLDLLVDRRLLQGLSHDDVAELLKVASFRDVPASTVLHVEGDRPLELFIVIRGVLTVHTRQAGRIARLRAGEMVGAMELFGEENAATVRTEQPCQLLVIERDRLIAFLDERPAMAAVVYSNVARLLSARLRKANRFMFLRGIARHRMLVLKVLAVIGMVVVLFTVGFGVASESPGFCTSCHYMQPYYDTWAVSSHNEVRCVECHYSYGMNGVIRGKITGIAMVTRYLTRTYDPKPEAEVSDDSCGRNGCHPTLATNFSTKNWPNVRFSHSAHADSSGFGARLRCTSCHQHSRGQNHFSVAAATCYLCHLTNRSADQLNETCRTCHFFRSDPERVQQVDHAALPARMACMDCHASVLQEEGRAEDSRCYSCHLEPRSMSTPELHRTHTEKREVACAECHSEISHEGGAGLALSRNCDGCHRDQHRTQEQIYLGQGGLEAVRTPGIMSYFHVECTGCHRNDAGEAAPLLPGDQNHDGEAAGDQICLNCHTVEYQDKLRMWQTTIEESLATAHRSLEEVSAELRSSTLRASPGARALADDLVADARHNVTLVEEDRSRGVHNFKYTRDLLRVAQQKLERALELLRG